MEDRATTATETARSYYNSDDADRFYAEVWGGEDIHVGIYGTSDDPIAQASARTVETMMTLLADPGPQSRILDIGSGYGGAARALAKRFGCQVTALNVSEVENARARRLNREQGLDHLVTVVDASFEELPFPNSSFDAVWSQDAILHSGDRGRVVAQVSRVLRPGGQFLMTDPMQSDDCPPGVLGPILNRIHLSNLGSPGDYRRLARSAGLESIEFHDLSANLVTHYERVLQETRRRVDQLSGISPTYIERMQTGLQHWIDGGLRGYLAWGIFHFKKPAIAG